MIRKKQVVTMVSIAVTSFLVGTMFSVMASNSGGSPWNRVWTAIFGLESRVETLEEQSLPQGFTTAPAYDSGWVFSDSYWKTLNHNLGTDNVFVYLVGRNSLSEPISGGEGLATPLFWKNLNTTHIDVYGSYGCKYVRVMIWKISEPPT